MLVKFRNFELATLLLAMAMLYACSGSPENRSSQSRYDMLKSYADDIKVINTHEHQRWSEDNAVMHMKLSHLIQSSYLGADVVSAGGRWIDTEKLDSISIQEYWDINGEALDLCRNTSYYSHFISGFQILYGFPDPYFTASNVLALSEEVERNYSDYRSWFHRAFEKAIRYGLKEPNTMNNLGTAYLRLGYAGKAKKVLKKALAIDPDNKLLHYNLSLAYEGLGEKEKSEFHRKRSMIK